ncbi:hypothetical protein HGRIS_000178 [Hohenbuehelia grisea]|uniref:ATP-dependent RNA helicase n=1 Tax=Hohenbuehelia grisea TaxID=104357 RepID=A0ABR3JS82_9AGAR
MDTDKKFLPRGNRRPEAVVEGKDLPKFNTLKGSVSHDTLKAITVRPFQLTHMSSVQAEVLPLLPGLARPYDPNAEEDPDTPSRDLFVRAKTGTGKTLAFLVPVIEARLAAIDRVGKQAVADARLQNKKSLEGSAKRGYVREHCGALIISPTRELATQIANEALKLSNHHADFEVRLMVGGESKRKQLREWNRGRRDILVATPGRLRDFLENEPDVAHGLKNTPILVLDEADVLLEFGFRDEIEEIKKFLPSTPERQTFLFSATVSPAIRQVAKSTLHPKHRFIDCTKDEVSPVHTNIPQYHTVLPSAAQQLPFILRLLAHDQLTHPGTSKTIVFFPTTRMTQLFTTLLRGLAPQCLPAGRQTRIYEIHSKRSTEQRTTVSDMFRHDISGASILLTSDVSARGVDYPGVTRVIQVGIPSGSDQYVHRVGRTGRAGTTGRGDLVLLPWEIGFVTWQLTDVPLRPITTRELEAQTAELAKKCDADPLEFFKAAPPPRPKSKQTRTSPVTPDDFRKNLPLVLDEIERNVQDYLGNVVEDDVKEVFSSLLGFYMSKTPELRVQKSVVVEGCKAWTTEAMGLPAPPYLSEAFLAKLGYHDGRTRYFARGTRQPKIPQNRNPWSGRGSSARWNQHRSPGWERAEERFKDHDAGEAQQYITPRYGRVFGRNNDAGTSNREGREQYGDRERDREQSSYRRRDQEQSGYRGRDQEQSGYRGRDQEQSGYRGRERDY